MMFHFHCAFTGISDDEESENIESIILFDARLRSFLFFSVFRLLTAPYLTDILNFWVRLHQGTLKIEGITTHKFVYTRY